MTRDEQVRRVGGLLLGGLRPDVRVAEVSVRGVRAFVFVGLVEGEFARRRACGAGPLWDGQRDAAQDFERLDVLLGLPAGLRVPLRSLSDRERAVLRGCPRGAVRVTGGSVVRLAVPPLRLDLAVVSARGVSRAAVDRTGRFASYAAAVGLWVTGPRLDSLGALRAEWFGHGLVHEPPGGGPELAALPRLLTNGRLNAPAWRFAEEIYEAIHEPGVGFLDEEPGVPAELAA